MAYKNKKTAFPFIPCKVIYSDGIRPGGDLTELDGSSDSVHRPPKRSGSKGSSRRHHRREQRDKNNGSDIAG